MRKTKIVVYSIMAAALMLGCTGQALPTALRASIRTA